MTHDEAVGKLNQLRTFFIGGATMQQALDIAIAVLERPAAPGKAIDHSGDSTDMVTQFDERVNEFRNSRHNAVYDAKDDAIDIMDDMQAHIRKLDPSKTDMQRWIDHHNKRADKTESILRELVELKRVKDTQGQGR